MKNENNNKKFVKSVCLIVSIMCIITATLGYLIDPNMYYRKSNNDIYYSEAYTTSGIIKNYPAQVAVVGSSMMQNMNMDLIKELFNKEAVKYTRSGMNVDEICMLINRSINIDNEVNEFIVNIDMTKFNTEYKEPFEKYPKYLYNESKIDDIKYLLGFETWTKFIPFNLVYNLSKKIDNSIGNKIISTFSSVVDIDNIGNWSRGTAFGEEIVKSKYINNLESVSSQNINDMLNRMKNKFKTDFYPTFYENKEKEFTIILPPYSALMWYEAEQQGYLNVLYDFKRYIVEEFDKLDNVTIYDFQDYNEIIDLNNYKDTTHYIPEFNDMMVMSILKNESILDISNVEDRLRNLDNLINKFKQLNKDWL